MPHASDRSDLDRDADLAAVKPCPNCGEPVRQFGSVPIGGSGTDLHFPGPWWCAACLQAKCVAARAEVRQTQETML